MKVATVALFLLLMPQMRAEKIHKGDPVTLCEFWKADANVEFLGTYCPAFGQAMMRQWHKQEAVKKQMAFQISPPDKDGVVTVKIAAAGADDRIHRLQFPTSSVSKDELRLLAKKHAEQLLPRTVKRAGK